MKSGLARKGFVAALVAVMLGMGAPTSNAMSPEEFQTMTERYTWLVSATSHPIQWVTYAGGPAQPGYLTTGEVLQGAPYTRIQSNSSPGVSEGFASLAYPSYVIDEGFMEPANAATPTLVRCSNPTHLGRGQQEEGKLEVGGGGAGGYTHSACPAPNEVTSTATFGPVKSDQASYTVGFAESHGKISGDGKLTLGALSSVNDLVLGDVSVGFARTHIVLEWLVQDPEPKLSYEIKMSGIKAGGQPVLEAGESVTLAGTGLQGGPELTEQFRQQVAEVSKTTKDLATFEPMFWEPQVYKDGDRDVVVQAPTIGFAVDNTPRRGQPFQYFAAGLGFARVTAQFTEIGAGGSEMTADSGEADSGGSFYKQDNPSTPTAGQGEAAPAGPAGSTGGPVVKALPVQVVADRGVTPMSTSSVHRKYGLCDAGRSVPAVSRVGGVMRCAVI